MEKLTKILAVAFTSLLLVVGLAGCEAHHNSASSELANPKQLKIGLMGTFPPYSYKSHGKLTGFETDVAKDVAKEMHLKPKFVTTPWDSLIEGLGDKRYDVVLNNISEAKGTPRAKRFISSTPYMFTRDVMLTSSHDKSIKTLHDIKGKTFADGSGSTTGKLAMHYGAKDVPSDNLKTIIALIKEHRVQGSIDSLETLHQYAKTNSTKGLRFYAIPNSQHPADKIAVLLNKRSPKLRNQVNKALAKLRKNGTLKRLSEKYFGRDITRDYNIHGVISLK